jgi:hypothetical protein
MQRGAMHDNTCFDLDKVQDGNIQGSIFGPLIFLAYVNNLMPTVCNI